MSDAPAVEIHQLTPGIEGTIEIPRLGTWDGSRIYCAYSRNTDSIWMQWTDDVGVTWSDPVPAIPNPGPRYITDANILVDRDRITVFATHVLDLPDSPGTFAKSHILATTSDDGGLTWSPAEPLPIRHEYPVGVVHTPVWMDGDTVVMGYAWDVPAEEHRAAADEGGMFIRSGVLISHDRGRTWTPGADVSVEHHPIGADEPGIVRLSNGDLFMVVRTSYPTPYETMSHDGGLTWEEPRPATVHAFNSPTTLLRLRDGPILRAWDNSPTARFPLVVAVSDDDCRTWSQPRTVTTPAVGPDGALEYRTACYPALAEAADGTVLMAWWQRTDAGENSVRYARLSREWIDEARRLPRPKRIVAFGDSVTVGARPGVEEHQTFRALIERGLTDEGKPVEVINDGLGGDNTRSALGRLDRDVLTWRPAAVIVCFGINDAAMVDTGPVARTEPRVPLDEYRANLTTIVGRIRAAGARVLLCTPTPMSRKYVYADLGAYAEHEDINYLVRQYAQVAWEVSADEGVPLVDLFGLLADRLELIEDGNHPFVEGHKLIAGALLGPAKAALGG